MRTVLDSFCRNFGNAPSDLHAGVCRHDDQAARAQPYLRALFAKGAANGSTSIRRRERAVDVKACHSPVSGR